MDVTRQFHVMFLPHVPLTSCVTSGGTVWDVLLLSKNRGASRAGTVLRECLVQTLHFVDERVSPARRTWLQVGHLVGDPGRRSGWPDSKEETAQECAMGCLLLQATGSHSTWGPSEDPCVEGCPCSSWGGSGGRGKALGDNAKSCVVCTWVSSGAQTEPLLEAGGQRGAMIQGTSRPEKV